MHTLCALGVSVLIGTSELGNPAGKKSTGAKSTGAKVVSSINGYDNDYCLIMPSSAESVVFELMIDEPTNKDMARDQLTIGHSCKCTKVVNNQPKAIVPPLAAAMKKESGKFINNVGLPLHLIVVVKSTSMVKRNI